MILTKSLDSSVELFVLVWVRFSYFISTKLNWVDYSIIIVLSTIYPLTHPHLDKYWNSNFYIMDNSNLRNLFRGKEQTAELLPSKFKVSGKQSALISHSFVCRASVVGKAYLCGPLFIYFNVHFFLGLNQYLRKTQVWKVIKFKCVYKTKIRAFIISALGWATMPLPEAERIKET